MRILWVVPGFPAFEEDPRFVFLREEAEALVEHGGVDLHIVATSGSVMNGPWASHEIVPGARTRAGLATLYGAIRHRASLHSYRWHRPGTWLPVAETLPAIEGILESVRPQIVHSHFAEPAGCGTVRVAKAHRAGAVVSLRGYEVARVPSLGYGMRLYTSYASRLADSLSHADAVLVATSQMAELAREAGANAGQLHILPNAYHRAQPTGPEMQLGEGRGGSGRARAIVIGGLTRRKGFDVAVEAARLGEFDLLVVGDGPEDASLRSQAGRSKQSSVEFCGALPPTEVTNLLRQCDVFWSTARFEAFGNVIVEAAAADLPLVCTRQGVAVDLIPRLDRASWFDGTAEDLVRATESVLRRPKQSRIEALQTYEPTRRTMELTNIYQAVCP